MIARIFLSIILKYLAILTIGLQSLALCRNYISIVITITTSYHVVLHQTTFVGKLCYLVLSLLYFYFLFSYSILMQPSCIIGHRKNCHYKWLNFQYVLPIVLTYESHVIPVHEKKNKHLCLLIPKQDVAIGQT